MLPENARGCAARVATRVGNHARSSQRQVGPRLGSERARAPPPTRPAVGTIECRRPPEWYNRAPNAGQLLAQPDIGRTSGIHSGRARPSRMIGGR